MNVNFVLIPFPFMLQPAERLQGSS